MGSAYRRRARHYDDMGLYHREKIVGILMGSPDSDGVLRFTLTGSDRAGRHLPDAQRRLDAWHEAMSRRSWEAARYRWITVNEERQPE